MPTDAAGKQLLHRVMRWSWLLPARGKIEAATIIDNQEAKAQLSRKNRITDIVLQAGNWIPRACLRSRSPILFRFVNPWSKDENRIA